MKKNHLLLLIALTLCIGYAYLQGIGAHAQTEVTLPLDVPSPTPTATPLPADGGAVPPLDSPLPTPTPTATPLSPAAEIAIRFVADKAGIPPEKLQVGGEEIITFPLLEREYTSITIFEIHSEPFRTFSLLVDPVTRQIEEDLNAVRAAEEAAYRERYGKFTPSLYERLQTVRDDEHLPIAVWVAQADGLRIEEELHEALSTLYPEANRALAEQGIPWAVEDTELARVIAGQYDELLVARVRLSTQPIIDWLRAQGFEVQEFPGMPSLAATLPRQVIVELAARDDIAAVYLVETEATPALDKAVPTDRAPMVWARGYSGSGVTIGVIEANNINATAAGCLSIVNTRNSGFPASVHKSRVAAIAACNDSVLRGIAPGTQLLDAGHNGSQADTVTALTWATDTGSSTPATVVNHSESYEATTALEYLDRVYDYWVRQRKFTAVIAAGNTSGNVTTPAKAYNVIAVGNVDDKNTASWSDDDMRATSAYINPVTGVEKPEVSAPGTAINTVAGQDTGTSFAAPQVAGLAAILMQRHSTLKTWPSVVKAIVMASAVHNIEGSKRLSDRDGAGAIDVALADYIAQTQGGAGACNVPCWWNLNTSSATPPVGGNLHRYFHANRGERIRVAISWLSQANSTYTTDSLLTNYDLYVITPNGETKSNIVDNSNVEIVDFTAPATGQYEIRVNRNASGDNNESGNFLGIAWVKLATYLPEVRRASDGWTSTIYVRNDGRTDWQGKVTFYHQTGAYASEASITLARNAVWSGAVPAQDNWVGTAIVEGSDDISVVTRNDKTGLATLDNGFTPGGATDPAWGQAGTVLYAPALYNNIFGGFNSTIYIQNPNATITTLTPVLYGRTGHNDYPQSNIFMGAGNQQVLPLGPMVNNTSWVGSFYGTADRPLPLRIFESKGSGESRSYNASFGGRSLVYVPVAYKNIWGFITGLVIQNLHASSSTNVTLRYCERTVTNPATCPTQTVTVPARRSVGINLNDVASLPNGWTGSVSLQSSSSSFPLAVAVTNSRSDGGYSVSGTGFGSRLVILPRAAKNANNRTTGYTVRNVSGQNNVTVTARYYRASDGNLTWTRPPFTLHSAQSEGYFQTSDTLPDGWEGSIVLEATADIVAVMREDGTATTSAYNGVSR